MTPCKLQNQSDLIKYITRILRLNFPEKDSPFIEKSLFDPPFCLGTDELLHLFLSLENDLGISIPLSLLHKFNFSTVDGIYKLIHHVIKEQEEAT